MKDYEKYINDEKEHLIHNPMKQIFCIFCFYRAANICEYINLESIKYFCSGRTTTLVVMHFIKNARARLVHDNNAVGV